MNVRRAADVRPRVLSTRDAATYVGLSRHTLKSWRLQGRGPAFVRLSPRKCGYLVRDLDSFLERRRREPDF